MTWRSWDKNQRSKRAIAIDRALQAKKVYSDFNDSYTKSQNRSDVEDWDIKGRTKEAPPSPTPAPKEAPKISGTSEYIPSDSEKKGLIVYFHKMKPIEQFKDLQTTRNVARTHNQVEAWKKNPKAFDIRGIDTQPKGYVENRIETTRKYLNVPIWENTKENRTRFNMETRGLNFPVKFNTDARTMAFQVPRGKGYIYYKKSSKKDSRFNNFIAHELGHQFDFTAGNYMKGDNIFLQFKGTNEKAMARNNSLTKSLRVFNAYFGSVPYAKQYEQTRGLKKGTGFDWYQGQTVISTAYRNDALYRFKNEEQFAEFFSSYLTNPVETKKKGKVFYNIFTKGVGKDLNKQLKRADFNFLSSHIGGEKASSFNLNLF